MGEHWAASKAMLIDLHEILDKLEHPIGSASSGVAGCDDGLCECGLTEARARIEAIIVTTMRLRDHLCEEMEHESEYPGCGATWGSRGEDECDCGLFEARKMVGEMVAEREPG